MNGDGGPISYFIFVSNNPLKIKIPVLQPATSITQRFEGNRKLSTPSKCTPVCRNVPYSIPVLIEPCFSEASCLGRFQLSIELDTGCIRPKQETVLLTLIRVYHKLNAVFHRQISISATVGNDNSVRVCVIANNPDIEHVLGKTNKNIRLLTGGKALGWLYLGKSAKRHKLRPRRITPYIAIQSGCLSEVARTSLWLGISADCQTKAEDQPACSHQRLF